MSGKSSNLSALVRVAAHSAGIGQRTDAELLADWRNGDSGAFEALIRRHGPMVLQTCRQVTRCEADAEDAFQTTFVLLHQKAGTIRSASVAGWLFRVARRAAGNARRATLRREHRESTVIRSESVPPADPSWREACAILHGELDQLPDRYRLPLVLCYLQGLSRDEAARRLGWSINEVRGRLERGRQRLRLRIEKRGITLSAGLIAALGARNASALPSGLVAATLAASKSGVVRPLIAASWKLACGLGIVVALVVGIGLQLGNAIAQPVKSPPPPSRVKKHEANVNNAAIVTGQVVDPDGKPVSGAKVFARRRTETNSEKPIAQSGADGRFTLSLTGLKPDEQLTLLASSEGFAAGWQSWSWTGEAPSELNLKLAKDDVPIRGRILDLQGKPIGGAIVELVLVQAFPNDDPNAFVRWLAHVGPRPLQNTLNGVPPGATAKATTDRDGRFHLTGLGANRVARLKVSGPAIAYASIYIATAKTLTPSRTQVYPATFDYTAVPSRLISGVVLDAVTKKPVPGLRITGYGGLATTQTDKDGRYQLEGYKKGPTYTVYASPADGSKYFPVTAKATDTAGLDPLEIDLQIRPGIPVSGRVAQFQRWQAGRRPTHVLRAGGQS